MLTIEHHARNLFWLFSFKVTPHTIFAFISYFIGWIAIIPGISTDLERELVERGVPIFIIVFFAWFCAHIFDRRAVVVKQQLRSTNSIRKTNSVTRGDFNA